MEIILASGSPRRIKMMKDKGFDPHIMPADVDENLPFEMSMEASVMYLAAKKALWVEANTDPTQYSEPPLIIAADTVVYKDKIIGKPASPEEAFEILSDLRADSHYVATGVCLLRPGTAFRKTFFEVTEVGFKDYSDSQIEAYINTDEPYDKAGGYAIQGTFGRYIDYYKGDYDNVVGFPWTAIEKELNKIMK